jgi:hypothetical protein
MLRVKGAPLAVVLLGASLAGCAEPAPHDFTLVGQRPAKAEEAHNTIQNAEANCKEDTERKGKANVLAIFSRLRPGSADKDYIACMKAKGFEVSQ